MLDANSSNILRSLIREYYSNARDIAPKSVEKREFGFGDFENKIAFRHASFKDPPSLQKYLVSNAPAYVSYSSAHYELPEARPMENKKMIGAELVFDLDASDLHLACQKEHGTDWVCENCLDSVKRETIRLIEDFLIPDFGFSKGELEVNFSGNRGYHVHVYNDGVFHAGSVERKEISSYISATDLEPRSIFPTLGIRGLQLKGPKPTDMGWGGKFARAFISRLNTGIGSLTELGIDRPLASKLVRRRTEIILGISTGNWDKVEIPKKAEFWSKVISGVVIKQSDSIDRNVTNDPNHLIRLQNSIHGSTGLIAKKFSLSEIDRFDPMNDAIAFGNEPMKVNVTAPKFHMGGEEFGPFDNSTAELPTYAAAYLLLKGKGTMK
jgi:DNA primase small subunit